MGLRADTSFESPPVRETDIDTETWEEFTRKMNELQNMSFDFGPVRAGEGSDVNFKYLKNVVIDNAHIADAAITNAKIQNLAVSDAKISSLSGDKIFANTIGANKLNVNQLSAISANIGSITAGSITGITITGGTIRTQDASTRVEMDGSQNALFHYQNGEIRTWVANGQIGFNTTNGMASGGIYGVGTNQLAINVGGNNSLLFNPSNFIPSTDNQVDLGNNFNRFRELYLSSNINFGGRVGNSLVPEVDDTYHLGLSNRRWRTLRITSLLTMHGQNSAGDRSFLSPSSAGACNLGTSSSYFHQMFANIVRYKSIDSFDHIEDLEAIKNIKIKEVEMDGPEDIDSKERVVKSKKIKKEVWDPETLPKQLVDKGFIDSGGLTGLLIGALKEMITKVEDLEAKVNSML